MRKCDLDADIRMPIDRASTCWNEDLESDCHAQSASLHTSRWQIVTQHPGVRRHFFFDDCKRPVGRDSSIAASLRTNVRPVFVSQDQPTSDRQPSCVQNDCHRAERPAAVSPLGFEPVSCRIASSYVLLKLFATPEIADRRPQFREKNPLVRCQWGLNVEIKTGLRSGRRTHSLRGVSDEKRNADERPPAGGEPNRHRRGWRSSRTLRRTK